MKRARDTLARITLVCVGVWLLWLFLPSDVVKSRYATLQAAREDRLFERGLLPDILPPSATDIVVLHDVDLNRVTGEFRIAPEEYPALLARTAPAVREGREVGTVSQDGHTWVFACRRAEGRCSFKNGPPRR